MAFKTNFKDEIPLNGERLYGGLDKNGAYVFRDVRIVRTNGNTQEGDTFGAAEVNEIGKFLNDTSHENMLINADFRNPVNQRKNKDINNTSTTQIKYFIDRWFVLNAYANIADRLHVSIVVPEGKIGYFGQFFEETLSGTYSVSINVPYLSRGRIKIYMNGNESTGYLDISKAGMHTYTFKNVSKADGLVLKLENFYGDIQWIKLECGESISSFVPRPFIEEVTLCMSFYEVFAARRAYGVAFNTTFASLIYQFINTKRVAPSVVYSGVLGDALREMSNRNMTPSSLTTEVTTTGACNFQIQASGMSTSYGYSLDGGVLGFDSEIYREIKIK